MGIISFGWAREGGVPLLVLVSLSEEEERTEFLVLVFPLCSLKEGGNL